MLQRRAEASSGVGTLLHEALLESGGRLYAELLSHKDPELAFVRVKVEAESAAEAEGGGAAGAAAAVPSAGSVATVRSVLL